LIALGIDTSCYTTSVCLIEDDKLISDRRSVLKVSDGACRLRQSEAVFQHVKNLPHLIDKLMIDVKKNKGSEHVKIDKVCATVAPRNVEGSYMPVFNVAGSFGSVCANLLCAQFVGVSHQESHIAAGVFSSSFPKESSEPFLVLHLSGGTTELLKVSKKNDGDFTFSKDETKKSTDYNYSFERFGFYNVEIIGGTNDLNAGQFIDRVGVALGLSFPAGPHLEKIASEFYFDKSVDKNIPFRIRPSVNGRYLSFSGPESAIQRQIKAENYDKPQIAFAVQDCVCESISKICIKACEDYNISKVLVVGGVASNKYIREKFEEILTVASKNFKVPLKSYFANPELSSDNAVGAAYIGSLMSSLNEEK